MLHREVCAPVVVSPRVARRHGGVCGAAFAWVLCVGPAAALEPPGRPPGVEEPAFEKAAPSAGFRCDGTDPFFFEELNEAGRLGYGETWDETLCNEGVEVYAEGASTRWAAWKRRPAPRKDAEEQALALVLPLFVFGGIGAVLFAAAAVAAALRVRRLPTLTAACPACAGELPISVENGRTQHLFCPMCGAPCSVDVVGKGKAIRAEARA